MDTAILDQDDETPALDESAGAGESGVHPVQRLKRGDPIGDKYIVQGSLGIGGFAVVYEAEHVTLGRSVAIKVLHLEAETSPTLVERFRHEARISALVHHPNILDVYDTGTLEDGSPYLVMELIRGETLYRRMARRGLTIPALVEVARQLLTALAVLGERGIVHRDIKPENVMLSSLGRGLTVIKVLDFGIAKIVEHNDLHLTISGSMIGTPHYMSPEQIRGESVDPRSDLYSLGVVLYEAITGRVPFDAATLNALVLAALNEDLTPIHNLRPDCPAELERIVLRAMSRNRNERYACAADMLADVERLAAATHMPRGDEVWGDLMWTPPVVMAPDLLAQQGKERHLRSVQEEISDFGAPGSRPAPPSSPEVVTHRRRRVKLLSVSLLLALGAMEPRSSLPSASLAAADVSPSAMLAAVSSRSFMAPPVHAAVEPWPQVTQLEAISPPVSRTDPPREARPRRRRLEETSSSTKASRPPAPKMNAGTRLVRDAFAAYLRNDLKQAHGLYRRAVAEAPKAAEAWRGLGLVAARLGRYDEARRALGRYLSLAPDAADAWTIADRRKQLP